MIPVSPPPPRPRKGHLLQIIVPEEDALQVVEDNLDRPFRCVPYPGVVTPFCWASVDCTCPAGSGPYVSRAQITASSWLNNRADLVFVVEPVGVLFVPLPKPFIKFLKRGNDGTEAEALRRL